MLIFLGVMITKNPFKFLTAFEKCLYIFSVIAVLISFALSSFSDVLTLISSLVGVTALIFLAKGMVIGQILTLIFSVLYGIISFFFAYYGEMITYLLMTAPSALIAIITWIKNPYNKTEVKVGSLDKTKIILLIFLCSIVTVAFYFTLQALENANLIVSTVSVTTSFIASYLSIFRSPYYAVAYALNDIVLIVIWLLATIASLSYLPMVICFFAFLVNDIYAFYNWQKIKKSQNKN